MYGLTALGREMSTPPTLQYEYGTLYLTFTFSDSATGMLTSLRQTAT